MLCTVGEVYQFSKDSHPDCPVGYSKFASLRPIHCILPGASGSHTICVCVIHQNVKLLLNALNLEALDNSGVGWSYKEILKRMVCREAPTESCFLGEVVNITASYMLILITIFLIQVNAKIVLAPNLLFKALKNCLTTTMTHLSPTNNGFTMTGIIIILPSCHRYK